MHVAKKIYSPLKDLVHLILFRNSNETRQLTILTILMLLRGLTATKRFECLIRILNNKRMSLKVVPHGSKHAGDISSNRRL